MPKDAKNKKASKADNGGKKKMSRKCYEKELEKLQVELCHLQTWVLHKGLRVVVVFEGRDAAGKGGVIKRITERVSPRVFRVVALPAPTERQKTQLNMQRFMPHFPSAGEVVLFDRSWYNRASVEPVMGFCTRDQTERFLRTCAMFEREVTEEGIFLIKYFFDISQEVQGRRFESRAKDPRKHWKLSPMDVESWTRWWEYTGAYVAMIRATDTGWAPWHRVNADDKRSARLNCISHLLSAIPYKKIPFEPPDLPKRQRRKKGVPRELPFAHTVPEIY